MKKLKKLAALLLALVMVFSMGMTALATNVGTSTTYTLTITDVQDDDQIFEAYQVFSGTLSADGMTLSDVEWGNGVDGASLLAALKADTTVVGQDDQQRDITIASIFSGCTTAEDVANQLVIYDSSHDIAEEFASVVAGCLTSTYTTSQTAEAYQESGVTVSYNYKITGLEAGYYFVKTKDDSIGGSAAGSGDSEGAYTRYILRVVSDVSVTIKAEYPTVDKQIDENGTLTDTNNAAIGDTVNYVVTSKVPDMEGYNRYYFVLTDEMEKGLDLVYINTVDINGDVTAVIDPMTITIGGTALSCAWVVADGTVYVDGDNDSIYTTGTYSKTDGLYASGDYYVEITNNSDGSTSIKLVFIDFLKWASDYGDEILIKYDAVLNTDAIIGVEGNDNEIKLTYSNNPNYDYDGKKEPGTPDEPTNTTPTGKTPEAITTTYVTEVEVVKINNNNETLEGAVFELTGTNTNTIIVTGLEYVDQSTMTAADLDAYVADGGETYWLLNDGTYTTSDPDELNDPTDPSSGYKYDRDAYASLTTVYALVSYVNIIEKNDNGTTTYSGMTESDGTLTFTGLSAGTYTLTELSAPDGYSKADDVTFTIKWTEPTSGAGTDCTWSVENVNLDNEKVSVSTSGTITLKITNIKGTELPTTGGIGTTIFYIVGAILIFGAVVVLITRRRMRRAS